MYPRQPTAKTSRPAAPINNTPLAGRDICRTFEGNGGYSLRSGIGAYTGPGHDETWWVTVMYGAEFLGMFPVRCGWGTSPAAAARAAIERIIDSNPSHADGLRAIAIKD